MYGKIFASTFTGSMFGRGPVMFSVWAFVLAHTDQTGTVELNPRLVASSLGAELNEVELAIQELCRPDDSSRNPADEGRRLIQEGQFTYRVVSHAIYQRIRTQDDRREYNRQKQAESRARKKEQASTLDKVDSQQKSALSAPIDIDVDVDIRNRKTHTQSASATENPPTIPSQNLPKWTHGQTRSRPGLVGSHVRCFHAPAACARGACVPGFLGQQWTQQLAETVDPLDYIAGIVAQAIQELPAGPLGDDPITYWRAVWSAKHGSQAPAKATNGRGNESAAAMARVIQKRQERRAQGELA